MKNSKPETRMTNQIQNPKSETKPLGRLSRIRSFGHSGLIRHSNFWFRISAESRPGSVLIIVIVLLLLLAILGAAYISTTRSARVASAQNVLSSDVDDMLNGISKISEGVIVDDLNDGLGNLQGLNPGATQNVHSAYQGTFVAGQTYNIGDIVSYPAQATAPPFIQTNLYVAVAAPGSATPAVGSTTPWLQTTHVAGITSSLIEPWLAERIPTPDGVTGTPATLAYWPNITQMAVPTGGNTPTSILGTPFESPDSTAPMPATFSPGYTLTGQINGSLQPGFKQIGGANGPYVPTLTYLPTGGPKATQIVAGDADGDGAADCFLFRIPGASYDGLTWYAGVRIIDNNSAVNANTAVSRDQEFGWPGGAFGSLGANSNYYSLFQSGVGLLEMLNTSDNANAFFTYLNNLATPSQAAYADAAPGATAPTTAVARPDFQFLTGSDAGYYQLTRRINNPGFDGAGTAGSNNYKAIPLSDEAALAYHFCLVNPETTLSGTPSSLIENLLPFSLSYWQAPSGTTAAQYYNSLPFGNSGTPGNADVNKWFNDNFDYDNPPADYNKTVAGSQPIRPLLVSRNPVSNSITPVYDSNVNNIGEPLEPLVGAVANPYAAPPGTISGMMLPYGIGPPTPNYAHYRGPWSGTAGVTYQFNDIVVGTDGYTYIYVSQTPGNTATSPTLNTLPPASASWPAGLGFYTQWNFQPWTKSPVKANVNTATFRELYRAFWSVMAGNPSNQGPFGANTNIYYDPYGADASAPSPAPPNPAYSPQHQFRSPLRDPTYTTGTASGNVTRLDPENTMLLRAALAAVNTLGLRDNSQNVISRTVYLMAWIAPAGGGAAVQTPVMARVYSNTPQPVISEVYVNTVLSTNPDGYVAVELYNPYSTPMILKNWQLGLVNRAATGGTYPNLVFTTNPANAIGPSVIAPGTSTTTQLQAQNDPRPIPTVPPVVPETYSYATNQTVAPGTIILPAHGYALLENYNGAAAATPATGDAVARPPSSGLPATGIWYGPGSQASPNTCDVYVPGLQLVLQGATGASEPTASTGGELVLLRPRRSDGIYTSNAVSSTVNDPLNPFNEGTPLAPNLYDLVPVDSYDFTGVSITTTANTGFSYVRVKGAAPATWFKQFYPGRYTTVPTTPPARQSGTLSEGEPVPVWAAGTGAPSFGVDVLPGASSYTNNLPPIQVYNTSPVSATTGAANHFPNATIYPTITEGVNAAAQSNPTPTLNNTATPVQAPFGTFARNGDMLDIPFVGAYRISQVNAAVNPNPAEPINFVELNSLPMDISFADAYADTDTADQKLENVGRFCPLWARAAPPAGSPGDFYAWTRNLFSYLTVQSPSDAELPNFDPNIADVVTTYSVAPNPLPNTYKYPPVSAGNNTVVPPVPAVSSPSLVLTADPTASHQTSQGSVGVEGLININTASWKVLSLLPMVTINEDPTGWKTDNENLAKAIVAWRITHGPFTSIYDLNSVIDYVKGAPNGFQNAEGFLMIANGGAAGGVSSLNGLLSPPDPAFPSATTPPTIPVLATPPGAETFGATATGIGEDYQSDFAVLNRISNLITTRSDTFTVYIEVQGWQNVGLANPQPMVTRRYAFIVDRSAINGDPNTRFLKTLTVPND